MAGLLISLFLLSDPNTLIGHRRTADWSVHPHRRSWGHPLILPVKTAQIIA